MNTIYFDDRTKALHHLCEKYQVTGGGRVDGCCFKSPAGTVHLLPWRFERRIIELKKIIDSNTLEDISTMRFCRMGSGNLDDQIYREIDICEWLGKSKVKSIFAAYNGNRAVNMIIKLENDVSCSIECAVTMPAHADAVDHHEIIARRGVAFDRAVDTQIPQSSIYLYSGKTEKKYTDVDSELFGLSAEDAALVRAAFQALVEPAAVPDRHEYLLMLVTCARSSEKNKTPHLIAQEG